MIVLNKQVLTYKCSITKDYFKIGFANTENKQYVEYEISSDRNDLLSIINLLSTKNIFVGYNCIHMEKPMCNFLFNIKNTFATSSGKATMEAVYSVYKRITEEDFENWKDIKYAINFASVDLMPLMFSRIQTKPSLRALFFDYNLDIDSSLECECKNLAAIANANYARINSRFQMSKKYFIDITDDDDVVAGIKIIKSIYAHAHGMKMNELSFNNKFDTIAGEQILLSDTHKQISKFIGFDYKKISLDEKFNHYFTLNNVNLSLTKAGLKSEIDPSINKGLIYYIDVKSMFPSIMLNNALIPKHLDEEFVNAYKVFYNSKMSLNETHPMYPILKNIINGVIGYMNVKDSYLYSPWTNMSIKLSAAFTMCHLISILPKNAKVLMVNIDSLCINCENEDNLSECVRIVNSFFNTRNIKITELFLKRWNQLSVNDYNALTMDDRIITKGVFSYNPYTPQCVVDAINQYLLFDRMVEYIINGINDIKKFTMCANIEDGMEAFYGDSRIDNTQRFYHSTNGKFISKRAIDAKTQINITKKSGVILCDKYTETFPKDINYRIYIGEANKILEQLRNKQLKLF